ncbi:MAG: ATP-binding cassette domain-containing protein, partial [Acidobacteriota bacterium]
RWLLRDIDLSVHAGETVALVGPSGSGKTLVLRALARLDPHDAGTVLWRGAPVADDGGDIPAHRARVHLVTQRPAALGAIAEDALRRPFALAVHARAGRRYDGDAARRQLAQFGRDAALLARPSRDLSGGERQLLCLLRALLVEPSVLLLDEPTAALDPDTAGAVEAALRAWRDAAPSRALVWVSHDPAQRRRVADRVVALRDGRPDAAASSAA